MSFNWPTVIIVVAALLGVVEGLTEFIPVSSTGHLILAGDLLGFESLVGEGRAKTFEIFIQLGAILAVVVAYPRRFSGLLRLSDNSGFTGLRGLEPAAAHLAAGGPVGAARSRADQRAPVSAANRGRGTGRRRRVDPGRRALAAARAAGGAGSLALAGCPGGRPVSVPGPVARHVAFVVHDSGRHDAGHRTKDGRRVLLLCCRAAVDGGILVRAVQEPIDTQHGGHSLVCRRLCRLVPFCLALRPVSSSASSASTRSPCSAGIAWPSPPPRWFGPCG